MRKILPFILSILFLIPISNAAHLSSSLQVNARCSGNNEVPAIQTSGYGLAVVSISPDRRSATLEFQATALSGPITGIHIHEAPKGENGPVVVNLTPQLKDNKLTFTLNNTADFSIAKLIAGDYYLNVHTDMNPSGEIRGQFTLESDLLFGGILSGSNEVPSINTNATGYVSAALSSSGNELTINAQFENLSSDIIGAHLHMGPIGINGGVVADLSGLITAGASIKATIDPTGLTEAMLNGEIYLNVHTVLNPMGELRAQLNAFSGLSFDTDVSGDNEVPPVTSNASGVVNFSYDMSTNSIIYEGYISNTSSAVVAAHLHNAPAGSNGGVLIDLSSTVTNGTFRDTISNVSTIVLDAMLSGQVYLNVHTEDVPSGELRGQITRLLREAYMCQLSGEQEVPSNISGGSGVAMMSIDRSQSNGHFMVVIDSLNSEFQAAHFHDGEAGVNGPVLFDITPFFIEGNAAFGYWTDMGDAAVAFRTSGVYLNVHTTDSPGGEIRGDYLRTSDLDVSYSSRAQLFVSSNTQGNVGVLDLGYSNENNLYTFPVAGADADGIYYDKESDRIFQVNRSMNRVDVYSNTIASVIDGLVPGLTLSSTSDFSNGRELTAGQGRIIVAQDANDANGQQNKLIVYAITESGLELESTFDVDINLWGIQLQGDRLWAIVDNSSDIAWYDDIFSQTSGSLMASGRATVEGLVRTHGLDYDAQNDLMVLTDVGAASSSTDGALVIVTDFSSAISDNMISADEQTRLEGNESELGNPVDVAIDQSTSIAFVAERANEGGKILAFDISEGKLNHIPVMSESYAGASAVYLSSTRTSGDFTPFNPQYDGRLLFTGRLSGGQEVPAVQTDATGVVGLLLNTSMDKATVNLSVNGLTGNFAGVHLHQAQTGMNGGVLVNLTDEFIQNRISTEIDIDASLLDMLMNGEIYINVHTDAFPDGELRAQLVLEKDLSYVNWISGAQEVPAVQTDATGLVSAHLTQVLNTLEVNAFFKDLSSHVTGAHLHMGAADENGSVVVDLTSFVNGQTISATVDASGFADELKAGNIYLNIHTENNPGGEIRAQLNEWRGITADGWIAGEQSVPANISAGLGITAVNLSPDRNTITVWAVSDDLSDDIAAAHLHVAEQGENGGVWIDVSNAVTEGNINFTSDDFDASELISLLSGNVYLNVHTPDFPAGEIRGQLYPLTRDAYNYSICQEQETAAVINAQTANGGGIASLDRNGSNIHLMAVVSGLSGPVTGIHLHQAEMDEDGPVILDLGPYLNNGGVFFYYSNENFNSDIGTPLRSGNTYINVHTDDNPAGEIRGQVIKSLECPISTSTEFVRPNTIGFKIAPNPASEYVDIQSEWSNTNSNIRIVNANGQVVKSYTTNDDMRINVQDLTPGIYYINLVNENQMTTHKMIKL